jgi:hypothetical protein
VIEQSQLAWIFGSPRSGSTWLWHMLSNHQRVVAVNEPLIGLYLGPFTADQPGVDPRELDMDNFTLRRTRRGNGHHFFADAYRAAWLPALTNLMLVRFGAQAAEQARVPVDRALVVVKEPNGSQAADLIMTALPQARFLFLLRDGRDVVDSELAANLAGSWAVERFPGMRGIADDARREFLVQASYKWLWRTQVVEDAYAAHPGPKLLVRYEELRADPRTHYRAIVNWLGVDVDDDELERTLEAHAFENMPDSERGPTSFYRSAKPGGWRENLSATEQAAVTEVIGGKLRELGYDG